MLDSLTRSAKVGLASVLAALSALAGPTVFWASDPVRPDETVVLVGDGLAGAQSDGIFAKVRVYTGD